VQNLTPGTSGVPHFEHKGCCGGVTGNGFTSSFTSCPHLLQNLASGLSWFPQWVQKFMAVLFVLFFYVVLKSF
jgi:hypothetical protein